MADSRIDKLIDLVKDRYDNGDPAHDFAHILRVVDSCKRLGQANNADLGVLLPAALLHDVINIPKNHPDRTKASQMAAEEAKGILKFSGFAEEEISKIAVVITEHSYSLGKAPSCIESAILQDADRLDALGAIGLMRLTTCGGRLGSIYYHQQDPLAEQRELDDKSYTVDHIFVKLLKLADKMNTSQAKNEAEKRTAFLKAFLHQLQTEIPQS